MIISSTQFPAQTGKLLRQPNPICLPRLPNASNGATGLGGLSERWVSIFRLVVCRNPVTKCGQAGLLRRGQGEEGLRRKRGACDFRCLLPGPSAHGCARLCPPHPNSHLFNKPHGAPLGVTSWVSNEDRAGVLPPKGNPRPQGGPHASVARPSSGGPGWACLPWPPH